MKKFDLKNIDFGKTIVIEASAGTGKTYNISGIYERLIRKGIDVKEILVVTFTENATNELRERIKKNLREFVDNTSDDNESEDYKNSRNALRMFDEANIFTIHGFCRKTLIENSFESNTDFDAEIGNAQDIINEIIYDFYRENFAESTLEIASFLKKRFSIDHTLELPDDKIVNSSINAELNENTMNFEPVCETINKLQDISEQMLDILNGRNSEIIRKIQNANLNGKIYNKKISDYLTEIQNDLLHIKNNKSYVIEAAFNKIELFTKDKMADSITKNSESIPDDIFFELSEKLIENLEEFNIKSNDFIDVFVSSFTRYIRKRLNERKKKDGIITFDDMIQHTYENLDSYKFREIISKKYKAVLIDEFQDTDIMQYTIFRRLFFETKSKTCFMIGDPKQSIYKFRGADIYSYIQARDNSDIQYTLDKNFRSEQSVIESINTIFSGERPFYNSDLEYIDVNHPGSEKENEQRFLSDIKELTDNFCNINFISDKENKPKNKQESLNHIINIFLHDITTLLKNAQEGKVKIGQRSLMNSDIGVIVRSNYQAEEIKTQLSRLNIPSVIYSNQNVYSSIIASDLKDIFSAVSEPNSFSSVKKALGTNLIFERQVINFSDERISDLTQIFVETSSIYNIRGISKALTYLDSKFNFRENLLKRENSERNITNLNHLEELIVSEIYSKGMSITAFIKEFTKKIKEDNNRENEQKIESDENAVKIITVHKSKGLQYSVVFYLSSWEKAVNTKNMQYPLAHNKETGKIELALLNNKKNIIRQYQIEDEFEESLRLFYVAVTRAVSRLYIYIPDYKESHLSPANYLFNYSLNNSTSQFNIHKENTVTKDTYIDSLKRLSIKSKKTININIIDDYLKIDPLKTDKPETDQLKPQEFSKRNIENRRTTSFSGLIFNIEHEKVEYEKDTVLEEREQKTIFDLPKGPQAGSAVHEIFEKITFSSDIHTIRSTIETTMKKYGWDEEWIFEKLTENIQNILQTQITYKNQKFRLCDIKDKDIVRESFFVFPVDNLRSEHIKELYNKYKKQSPQIFSKMDFEKFSGYISGFIDVMFRIEDRYFVLDWKTNSLGYTYEDYSQQNIKKAMKANYYHLQYYIYSEALQRYLPLKIKNYTKEKNWGGVYYLFTRGMKPGNNTGIYYDELSNPVFEEFRKILGSNR